MQVDIFCRVIDNWGDAGVCWRLAKQFAREYGARVRLLIDDPSVLRYWQVECPSVEVVLWDEDTAWRDIRPASWVIESFACDLPTDYVAQILPSTCWLNLEYLSAEHWVDSHHGLPSPQTGGRNKVFYFPGFTEATGGLLRERNLLAQRDHWRRNHPQGWVNMVGLPPDETALKISVFSYLDVPMAAWLSGLIDGKQPIQLAITHGLTAQAFTQAWQVLHLPPPNDGVYRAGMVQARLLPMLSQTDYDALLWSADFNFVRGEDSFVRALWAGNPLAWHIYRQDDGAHEAKISAFAARYGQALTTASARAWQDWQQLWNGGVAVDATVLGQAWQGLLQHLPQLNQHAQKYADGLAQQPDLLAKMVQGFGLSP